MDYSKLEPHRVDHLIVLVGSNPLPNLVAIRLLLDPDGARQVSLVHSNQEYRVDDAGATHEAGTLTVAENIRDTLVFSRMDRGYTDPFRKALDGLTADQERREHLDAHHLKYVGFHDPSNSRNVAEAVLKCLNRHLPSGDLPGKTVGIHYSGGTKTMASYAVTQALVAAMSGKLPPASKPRLSHLDARQLRLVFDDPASPLSNDPDSVPVGDTRVVPLIDQIRVHGWELLEGYTADVRWDNALRRYQHQRMLTIAKVACQGLAAFHSTWSKAIEACYPGKRRSQYSQPSPINSGGNLQATIGAVTYFHDALRKEFNLTSTSINIVNAARNVNLKPQDLGRWIKGSWLETLTLEALQDCKNELDLRDLAMGLKCKPAGSSIDDFEIDAVALRGYQLFALSCTTSPNKGTVKTKLFEAYHRARQIGGDEARVAVVCAYNNPQDIANEMFHAHGLGYRVRVFGYGDLLDLNARVKEWIEEASP